MRFNAVSSFSIATFMVSFLISPLAFSEREAVPPERLCLRRLPRRFRGD